MDFKKTIDRIAMGLAGTALLGISYITYSAGVPGSWMYERNRAEDRARAIVLREEYEKRDRMEILERKALEKADNDGLPGISFQEQANFLKNLGCELSLFEGDPFIFVRCTEDFRVVGRDSSGYSATELVSEKQVKDYVEGK